MGTKQRLIYYRGEWIPVSFTLKFGSLLNGLNLCPTYYIFSSDDEAFAVDDSTWVIVRGMGPLLFVTMCQMVYYILYVHYHSLPKQSWYLDFIPILEVQCAIHCIKELYYSYFKVQEAFGVAKNFTEGNICVRSQSLHLEISDTKLF